MIDSFDSTRLPGELQLLDRFNRINGADIRSTHQLRRFRVIGGVNHVVPRISDLAMVLYRQDQSPRLDFWGSDVRSHTT